MKNSSFKTRIALLIVAALAMIGGFSTLLFNHAPGVFNDPKEDMSFGWFVPVFSLYVIWTEREKLVKSLGRPGWGGLVLMLPFLFIGFLGVRGIQVRLEMLSFIGLLVAVPWALFGRETARRMLFPAGFLLFCIPLSSYLDIVTVHLRLFATGMAHSILVGVGANVQQSGTALTTANGFGIDIAEPCSGLRSIFALLALTAGYAYFNQPTWLRRALLFACAIPLAVLGNVVRVLTICLVGAYASPDFAIGFYHDYSGYVVFVVAILLMVGFGELISWAAMKAKPKTEAEPKDEPKGGEAESGKRIRAYAVPVLATALLVVVMSLMAVSPEPVVCDPPAVTLSEIDGYEAGEVTYEMSEEEKNILPSDTKVVKRSYSRRIGWTNQVSAVIGGTSKSSIHRPELCLKAQGFLMMEPREMEVDGVSWHCLTIRKGYFEGRFAYTFFNQAGYRTSSHLDRIFRDVWDRSIYNRVDRWVMISVQMPGANELEFADFLMKLKGAVQ